MPAELIYRTSSPAAEAWFHNGAEIIARQTALRHEFEQEMLALYGPARLPEYLTDRRVHRYLWVSDYGVTGLDSGFSEQPPAGSGWRLDSKERIWKPALRTAAGRALKERIQGLTLYATRSHLPEIGVPDMIWGGTHIYRPGLDHDDEPFTMFQVWGSGECAKECLRAQEAHPEVEWTEVPRSEWYARIEAQEAAEKANES